MNRAARRILSVLGAHLVLAAIAVGAIYLRSEQIIRRTYAVPLEAVVVPSDAASIAEGERKARILGCYFGCHSSKVGTGFDGDLFDDDEYGRVYAPDLTRAAARETDAELERTIRHAVRQDGTSVWEMPVPMFQHLSDEDLGQVIAFLRSQPLSDGPTATIEPSLRRRWTMVTGEFLSFRDEIAKDVTQYAPHALRPPASEPLALGRYLAMTVCTECHQQDLHGGHQPGHAVDLAVVAAYPPEAFVTLMRTGVPLGGRDLGLMRFVALSRFAHFTDAEIAALHGYLAARGRGEVD